jgi:HK97 family phage major capsid protein
MYERQEAREAAGTEPHAAQSGRDALEPESEGAPVKQIGTGKRKMVLSGGPRASKEYNTAMAKYLATGKIPSGLPSAVQNALQADSDPAGGFLTMSEQMANRIIEAVDNLLFFRSSLGCTVTMLTSASGLGIPTRVTDASDATWTTEIKTGDQDTSLSFGKRELKPHPIAKKMLLSKKLLRLRPDIQDYVLRRLAYKMAVPQEYAFLLGTGVQQPLGVFTPSLDGISTARDIATGSPTGFIASSGGTVGSADVLFDALYSLKAQYQQNANWLWHRLSVAKIRKIKDAEGRYVWQPGIQSGDPARILDRPYFMSEYVPSTYTTGQYIGIVGDFSHYEIVDALDMEIQVLLELYSENNQIGYHLRAEVDGAPVLEEAFARIVLS